MPHLPLQDTGWLGGGGGGGGASIYLTAAGAALDAMANDYMAGVMAGLSSGGGSSTASWGGSAASPGGSSDNGIAELPLSVDPSLLSIIPGTLPGSDYTSLAADLATTDPTLSTFSQGNVFLGPYSDVGNLSEDMNAFFGAGYDQWLIGLYAPGGMLGPPAPTGETIPGFTFVTSYFYADGTLAGTEFSYIGYYDNTTADIYVIPWGGNTFEESMYINSGGQTQWSDTIYVDGVGVLYGSGSR